MSKNSNTAVLILGHGSHVEDANSELLQVTEMVKGICEHDIVETAFLQIRKPYLREGVFKCVEKGAKKVIVVPYFLCMGAHVQKDLPGELEAIKSEIPEIDISLTRHIGVDPKIAAMVCDRIMESESTPS